MTDNTLLYTSVSYCSVDVQIPFHWPAVCLFVVISLFLFNHSGLFFLSLFINNMQVQMLLRSLKLTVMYISFTVAQSCSKIMFSLH